MLFMEKISLYYEKRTKHVSTSMGQNPEILVLKFWDVYLPIVLVLCTFVLVYCFQYVMVLIFLQLNHVM